MNPEPQPTRAAGSLKKKMLLALVIITLVFVLMFVLITVLENWLVREQSKQPVHGTEQTIIFYPIDYDEDITKDQSYMGRDRQIYYADLATGVTISLNEDTYGEHGEGVKLLCHMIESIIAGDHETYNSFFTEDYLDREGEKSMFTAQKLYEIKITRLSAEEVVEDGLTNQVDNQEILFEVVHGVSKKNCCERLLNIAKNRGAPDNVTVVLAQV